MDGIKFDLLHPHLSQGAWGGLLVEPVSDMFEALRDTYKNQPHIMLANCAISDHDGTMMMKRVNPRAIAEGILPEEALGLTTGMMRGTLNHPNAFKNFPQLTSEHIIEFSAPCFTLPKLLKQGKVDQIDVVVIDTEGADWLIARQLDLALYTPRLICLEHTSLSNEDRNACLQHFLSHGYTGALCQEDRENFLFTKGLT